jgi:hypothetical protein
MTTKSISNHIELKQRIMQLNFDKYEQEERIKYNLKEIYYSVSLASIAKNTLHELLKDKQVQRDVTKIGLNLGTDYLIGKVLGRNKSVKAYLSSLVLEKISSSFIKNNVSGIISGISKLISKKKGTIVPNNNQNS